MKKGQFYYVDYSGYKESEINDVHLGTIYKLPDVRNMLFCIPLTSPKAKHFKTHMAFNKRNYNELSHHNHIYIDQTDSIALMDQVRTISIKRLLHEHKNDNNDFVTLNEKNTKLIYDKLNRYLKRMFE